MPDDWDTALRAPESGETLGQYLRAMRLVQHLSWDYLVKQTPSSQSTIRKIELGLTPNPGVFTVLPILDSLHLSINCLQAFRTDRPH